MGKRAMVCRCEDCGHPFRPENGDDKRHVFRDDTGMLWRFCHFCLELARYEDRARRALQEFDGPIRTWLRYIAPCNPLEDAFLREGVRDYWGEPILRAEYRPFNAWGEDE